MIKSVELIIDERVHLMVGREPKRSQVTFLAVTGNIDLIDGKNTVSVIGRKYPLCPKQIQVGSGNLIGYRRGRS